MVVVNAASLSRASTKFSCVLFSSAVKCAFVLVRRAVVARSAAVAVARGTEHEEDAPPLDGSSAPFYPDQRFPAVW